MIRLGSTKELITRPLHFAIQTSLIDHPFKLIEQSLEQNCQDLLEGKLDVAAISAIDYARHSSELTIVKDFAVFTSGAGKYALLFFRENLQSIEQVAFLSPQSQYQLLANLVLEEFYEMELDWAPLKEMKSLDSVLSMFPACLLEGDEALENYPKFDSQLDILEEWHDKTELNYVHQLIALNREAEDTGFLESLHLAREIGMRNLMQIAKEYAVGKGNSWDFYFDILNENFQFFPTEETWDSLRQYFEYLFYYGQIDFIPDLHFS